MQIRNWRGKTTEKKREKEREKITGADEEEQKKEKEREREREGKKPSCLAVYIKTNLTSNTAVATSASGEKKSVRQNTLDLPLRARS